MAARGVVLVRTVSRARVAKFPLMGIQPWRQQLRGLVNFKIRPKKGGVRHGGRQADYQFVQKKEQREVKRIAPAAFAEKARNLVERLAKGSEPLQDANAGLVVTRADDGLSFEIDHGGDIFSVTVDEASQTLSVLTPRTAAAAATGGECYWLLRGAVRSSGFFE